MMPNMDSLQQVVVPLEDWVDLLLDIIQIEGPLFRFTGTDSENPDSSESFLQTLLSKIPEGLLGDSNDQTGQMDSRWPH
jgi:hypothetical protein